VNRKIVITGVGAVTPMGIGADALHRRAVGIASGITGGMGLCVDFDNDNPLTRREQHRMDRFSQLAVVAADEAMEQAGWDNGLPTDPRRIPCYLGTAIGGLETLERQLEAMKCSGTDAVSPLTVPMMMANAAPANIAMRYGLRGESASIISACSSGAQAAIAGVRAIRTGEADAAVVGGAEAATTTFTRAIFAAAGAISSTGESTPFDNGRNGFILGEGSGVLLPEAEQTAVARGATVLGEFAGYGVSSDAYHLTAPEPDGTLASYAIARALEDAGATPDDVAYINAHGTGTELNDVTEINALRHIFGDALDSVPISSTKSYIGHLFGAAGAVEAIATLQALRYRQAPPTFGLKELDTRLGELRITDVCQDLVTPGESYLGLSNSMGFGGHNVTVAIRA
jgi:3-oxoacyl-[acyl-carrier-protein] synthase II